MVILAMLFWTLMSVVFAYAAEEKGRSFFAFLLLGLVFSPIFSGFALLVFGPRPENDADADDAEMEMHTNPALPAIALALSIAGDVIWLIDAMGGTGMGFPVFCILQLLAFGAFSLSFIHHGSSRHPSLSTAKGAEPGEAGNAAEAEKDGVCRRVDDAGLHAAMVDMASRIGDSDFANCVDAVDGVWQKGACLVFTTASRYASGNLVDNLLKLEAIAMEVFGSGGPVEVRYTGDINSFNQEGM